MKALGKLFLSIAISIYAFLPAIVDLTSHTHVFHPQWLPHAKMHTVWLLGVTFSVGLIALYLVWTSPRTRFNLNLAGALSVAVFGAFFVSAATIDLYGGALNDFVGEPTTGPFGVEPNIFVFAVATVLLVIGWIVDYRQRA